MCIGGTLHSTDVEMPTEGGSYWDLGSASAYLRHALNATVSEEKAYTREVLAHETIVRDAGQIQMLLVDAIMKRWFEEGKEIDVPSQAPIVTAGSPAGTRQTTSGLVLPG
jgi:hypothetical protein